MLDMANEKTKLILIFFTFILLTSGVYLVKAVVVVVRYNIQIQMIIKFVYQHGFWIYKED
jgi:hypothetical protein